MSPAVLLLAAAASAQDYAFPVALDDYPEFYVTAYRDHGGETDWNCGDITYAGHDGSDFGGGGFAGMDEGRPNVAAADGTGVATNDGEFDRCTPPDCSGGGGFGNYVEILHADGKTTWYGHLKQFSVAVSTGDTVGCGQVLGEMGSSGFSTGPHLHFEVRNSGGASEDPFDGPCSAPPSYWRSQGAYADLPDPTCGPPPVCAPVDALVCGETRPGANDDPGSTTQTWQYGCTDFAYSGPELSWTFSTTLDEPVTLNLRGLAADLDLYVLDSVACDGTGCLASSSESESEDETLTFDAVAGAAYVVVIDGFEGAVSDFSLEVGCDGAAPGPAPEDTGTSPGTTDTDTDTPSDTDAPDTTPGHDGPPSAPRIVSGAPRDGCGCNGAPGAAGGLALLALGLARRRR